MIDNLSRGGDPINPITAAATFAQMGIGLGVFLRSRKDKDLRSLSFAATLSGLLAGVTEPLLYGLILRHKRLIPLLLISGGIGGGLVAFLGVKMNSFVFNSVFTIPAYTPTIGYIIGIGAAFVIATILAFTFGTTGKKEDKETPENNAGEGVAPSNRHEGVLTIDSPIKGEAVSLEKVNDPVFSTGAMGKGIAIEPTEGIVVAPFDGKIATLFPTKHAIGLVSDEGVEVLIHIGMDTVQLAGEHFEAHVEAGASVNKGDKLVSFSIDGIVEAGYQVTTPIIVTNTGEYLDVIQIEPKQVEQDDQIITIIKE